MRKALLRKFVSWDNWPSSDRSIGRFREQCQGNKMRPGITLHSKECNVFNLLMAFDNFARNSRSNSIIT